MKIIAISDLHGILPEIKEEFDLLLICGDVCPAHDHYFSFQIEWLKNEFVEWINKLPFKNQLSRVVMVGGNHDFVIERMGPVDNLEILQKTLYRLNIIKNGTYDFDYLNEQGGLSTLKIFGTSYCKIFGNWAFMVSDDILRKKYSQCPDDVDIIISHDSPCLNGLGTIDYGTGYQREAGNAPLADLIEEKKPKYFFSGHIHSGNHKMEKVGDTFMANVSIVNEAYDYAFEPLIVEF